MSFFTVIIPARYGSTRLEGKPLLDLAGKPVIQRVYEQARQSDARQVVIATDDVRIRDCAVGFGARVFMTAEGHESGTDRLQEVATQMGLADDEIVVNVQGDEPLIPPNIINQVATNLAGSMGGMATLSESVVDQATAFNPNAVKVVCDKDGYALYFSRAPVPWERDSFSMAGGALPGRMDMQRHIGIYAYRTGFLHQFVAWGPCALEQTEVLEQLRALWHGVKIHVAPALESPPPGIDTREELENVRNLLQKNDG